MQKHKIKFGTTTATAGETVSQGTDVDWLSAVAEYSWMDVVINVKTLTGTSMTFSVQEMFDGTNYMETAKTAALTATGVYTLCSFALPNAALTKATGAFPMLGKGDRKQVVTSASSITGFNADIWFIFYK